MKVNRKVTDFINLEDGNIGRKAALVTGALLASTVLGAVLTVQVAEAHCDHTDGVWTWTSGNPPHNDYSETHFDNPACM